MKKFFALMLVFVCFLLFSCTAADVTVPRGQSGESRFPQEGSKAALTVNISSGTFHLDGECRYAKNMKEENKKIIFYGNIKSALADGYKPCSVCAKEYKT
ncbi:MAG: hypothetical protein IJW21_07200, partial [Clostridia bacterium]|nr:hypothetical protein [Clostridia bacterium]